MKATMDPAVQRLCFALDDPNSLEHARALLRDMAGRVGVLKLNSTFMSYHSLLMVTAAQLGYKVWADVKAHDVAKTVEATVKSLGDLGVQIVTIHISGGPEMVAAAVRAADLFGMTVLGITVLTTIDQGMLNAMGVPGTVEAQVLRLAQLGVDNGIHGIVCSGLEAASVRERYGNGLKIVTPGIRFPGSDHGLQRRVVTPGDAIRASSDLIVMGTELMNGGVATANRAVEDIRAALAG